MRQLAVRHAHNRNQLPNAVPPISVSSLSLAILVPCKSHIKTPNSPLYVLDSRVVTTESDLPVARLPSRPRSQLDKRPKLLPHSTKLASYEAARTTVTKFRTVSNIILTFDTVCAGPRTLYLGPDYWEVPCNKH